jgi:thiol-disulfide isomerase/thioredoxin
MQLPSFRSFISFQLISLWHQLQQRTLIVGLRFVVLTASILTLWLTQPAPAWAGLTDDRFDGNIFALYGGNGSLVPPKVTLAQAFQRQKPILLMFYVNDSSDCKQFATVVSQLQAFYGKVADFIPVNVDAIPADARPTPNDPGYYYTGSVPQTILFDATGKQVLNLSGRVPFESIDDAFRQVFDLLPRSESVTLKRRSLNEINVELSQ